MNISAKKLVPDAKLPLRAHADDAGLDLFSAETYTVAPGERIQAKTGIAMAIPTGYAGLIWDKSGVAAKGGIKTMGGVIDAAYRGEIQVILTNLSNVPYTIEKGAKIAQLLVQPVELPSMVEVDTLEETARGEGGFGSTGLH